MRGCISLHLETFSDVFKLVNVNITPISFNYPQNHKTDEQSTGTGRKMFHLWKPIRIQSPTGEEFPATQLQKPSLCINWIWLNKYKREEEKNNPHLLARMSGSYPSLRIFLVISSTLLFVSMNTILLFSFSAIISFNSVLSLQENAKKKKQKKGEYIPYIVKLNSKIKAHTH